MDETAPAAAPIPPCDLCGATQIEPGAMLWGPPDAHRLSLKTHVCVTCYGRVLHPELDYAGSDKARTTLKAIADDVTLGIGGYVPQTAGNDRALCFLKAAVRGRV